MAVPLILLVDDTRLFLSLEKEFLRQSAVRVTTAASGAEALELARRTVPSLIFMDFNMPGMDGAACCRLIKEDPALCHIPVIMLTTRREEEEACRKAGCSDFLLKPLNRRLFLDVAKKHLGEIDRRDCRQNIEIEISLSLGGRTIRARSADLSSRGIFVACATEEPADDEVVDLTLHLPAKGLSMRLPGRVAWVNPQRRRRKPALPAGFGVEFLSPPHDTSWFPGVNASPVRSGRSSAT